jgi:hypothetical protein
MCDRKDYFKSLKVGRSISGIGIHLTEREERERERLEHNIGLVQRAALTFQCRR